MQLPRDVHASLNETLAARGLGVVASMAPVGGGCIGNTTRVRTDRGAQLFLKWSRELPHRIFAEEASALDAIAQAGALRVPTVIAWRDEPGVDARWLLLEWLEPGNASDRTWEALGLGLADQHRVRAAAPGWPSDNFIGSLVQQNGEAADWPSFWRERRLQPQAARARDAGLLDAADTSRLERLYAGLDEILAPEASEGASLLHGDLWNGNVLALADGSAAVIDPAACYGHREVDLGMAELFGGFGRRFFEAYRESWPTERDYERRRAIYQLYYLLVHVNLFGRSYRAQTLDALAAAGF